MMNCRQGPHSKARPCFFMGSSQTKHRGVIDSSLRGYRSRRENSASHRDPNNSAGERYRQLFIGVCASRFGIGWRCVPFHFPSTRKHTRNGGESGKLYLKSSRSRVPLSQSFLNFVSRLIKPMKYRCATPFRSQALSYRGVATTQPSLAVRIPEFNTSLSYTSVIWMG